MWQKLPILLMSLCLAFLARAQSDTIYLKNGSFEDIPQHSQGVRGWIDCGFTGESPPDVQPFGVGATWGQQIAAYEGDTYLGMVVRDNDTYERVCQRLMQPLYAGNCYSFSIFLCSSDNYMSQSHKTGQMDNYVKPAVMRIFAGNEYCDRRELLAESPAVTNKSWKRYDFVFKPKGNYSYIQLEAFYKTPAFMVYNGNILVDAASPIIQTSCPSDEPLVAVIDVTLNGEPEIKDVPPKRTDATATKPVQKVAPKDTLKQPEVAVAGTNTFLKPPKKKILKNLERDQLVTGQTIRIENLYFDADSSEIDTSSYEVLDEIAYFLSENKDVIVEIGGHTNNRPVDSICDRLSTDRAKAVADYLKSKGIAKHQLESRGYGKRKPIMSNYTLLGRQRNQRVEIRILSFEG
jgi:outer membrane protein OmpA-like peptidoglycan-associated protein